MNSATGFFVRRNKSWRSRSRRSDQGAIAVGKCRERQPDLFGDRTPGGEFIHETEFVEWIGIGKRAHRHGGGGAGADHDHV